MTRIDILKNVTSLVTIWLKFIELDVDALLFH